MNAEERKKEAVLTVAELPTMPPESAMQKAKNSLKFAWLIYRSDYEYDLLEERRKKSVHVVCTDCGREYYLPYIHAGQGCGNCYPPSPFGFMDPMDGRPKFSGESCMCPFCGACAEAKHIGKMAAYEIIESKYFLTIHNVRGHLALLSWIIQNETDKQGRTRYIIHMYEAIIPIDGRAFRATGYNYGMYRSVYFEKNWILRSKFRDNCDEWNTEDVLFFDKEGYDASEDAKSAIDVFITEAGSRERLGGYIHVWCKYPQIENLVRSGYSHYVNDMIKAATTIGGYSYRPEFSIKEFSKNIETKKFKPYEIIGIEKHELEMLKKYSPVQIQVYKNIKKEYGIKLPEEVLERVNADEVAYLYEIFSRWGLPIIRTINYMYRQKCKYYYFRDYLSMLYEVYDYGPVDINLCYPKNITVAHDRFVKIKTDKANEICDRCIKSVAEEQKMLSYEDEETGLFIRPCADMEELIKEGKTLEHCVASYAKEIAQRKTTILFIRKKDEPDTPFYTLEYKAGKVIQNRGKRNCARTEEVEKFEAKWLEYLDKEKKHGRLHDKTHKLSASA